MTATSWGRISWCCVVVVVISCASPAWAFVVGCHQSATTEALDTAAWPLGAQSPELTQDQALLREELTIDVAPRVMGFWPLSVLIGNQYSDGGSVDAKDVVALAELTARPEQQPAHCLRRQEDDGVEGDATALAACKAFILGQIDDALGPDAAPDLGATETVRLHLVFRGDADLPLNRYAFHMGRATHALQDSFTHAFRSADLKQVWSVLNWVDWIGNSYVPARDGFQHILALDNCGPSDVGGLERRAAATQATAELLSAVAQDAGGRDGRTSRAAAVLDSWLQTGPACGADNHWCDTPEQNQVGVAGCAVADGNGSGRGAEVAVMATGVLLAAFVSRRRARARRALGALSLALVVSMGGAARAEDESRGEVKGGLVGKAGPEEQKILTSHPFGVVVSGGFAIDNAGYDVGVGARYDLNKLFTVGLSVEYSPWLSIETSRATRGTTDVFAVGIYRLDVRDYLELRLTVAAGVSVLMFDTWAARQGSVGPYFAISPLGLGIRMNRWLRLLIDPAELSVAIPQTTGIPLAYREHRFEVAVQANF